MAKVCFVPAQGTLAAYLTGEIDHHAAQALRREIDAQIDARMPELLTMDFSGVTFMDSSGVGLILGRGRQMSGLGGRLVVQNAPDTVRRMLDLAHIHYVQNGRVRSCHQLHRPCLSGYRRPHYDDGCFV